MAREDLVVRLEGYIFDGRFAFTINSFAGGPGPACRSVESAVGPGDEVGPPVFDTGGVIRILYDVSRRPGRLFLTYRPGY